MNRITKSKEMPVYLFHQGTNAHAWELLGAHRQQNGKTSFCTWAPHAAAVCVVGDFNGWDAAAHPMTRLNNEGLWGTTVELAHDYDCYKYIITIFLKLLNYVPYFWCYLHYSFRWIY